MSQRRIHTDAITVASSYAVTLKDLGFHQVLDYFLGCPLGNTDLHGHGPQHHVGIAGQTQKHMGMIVQKSPLPGSVSVTRCISPGICSIQSLPLL
jgi:hypothetical protein